ncbi:hypothetical protein S14_110 [Shewanella sp. phage 1/4]|uniref:hypothetical protein n=1 Tax=Shewanella phage 1/4 TaxID=1458859 RepID=UPI0004F6A9F2|nr:hypothetical protein S14_110 [Shewanella sp. phage 1/4]AHK11219.1 hypothetical protein S14_110 [Shewanella sp. phage 1/4]
MKLSYNPQPLCNHALYLYFIITYLVFINNESNIKCLLDFSKSVISTHSQQPAIIEGYYMGRVKKESVDGVEASSQHRFYCSG